MNTRNLAHTREAARLLGVEVSVRRKLRRWTESELAERAGISRTTLRKVEAGSTSVALGTAFDVATLVGLSLFEESAGMVARERALAEQRLTLLPQRVRTPSRPVFDDF